MLRKKKKRGEIPACPTAGAPPVARRSRWRRRLRSYGGGIREYTLSIIVETPYSFVAMVGPQNHPLLSIHDLAVHYRSGGACA